MKKINFKKALTKAGGVGIGVLGANAAVNKLVPATMNKKIVGAGEVLLGAIAPEFFKGKNNDLVEGIGAGVMADGWLRLGREIAPNIISGPGDNNSLGTIGDSGYSIDEDNMSMGAIGNDYADINGVSDMAIGNVDDDGEDIGNPYADEIFN